MSQAIIVAKFGGTSMADATAVAQSATVAVLNKVSLVVVSAASGTTNKLVELVDADQTQADTLIDQIITNHLKIAADLSANQALLNEIETLFAELKTVVGDRATVAGQRADDILAFGELLSSRLMIAALDQQNVAAELLDAREVLKTDDHFGQATPLIDQIRGRAEEIIKPRLGQSKVLVIQGFIGATTDGVITTLGRGGSDYSAALLAEALGADRLQIWTDVAGIASTDPRITKEAQRIEQLTFQEAAELATAGARVLYPRTITPLRRAKIPLYVRNTFDPEADGTIICEHVSRKPRVRAIALKPKQSILKLTTPEMAHQFGFLARVFNILADFKVSIDQISTSEISIAVVMDDRSLLNRALISKLKEMGEVVVEKDLSVVSLIGNQINDSPGLIQDIFGNLEDGHRKIPIKMICQGASQHNLCFLVPDEHGRDTVIRLHEAFIVKASALKQH